MVACGVAPTQATAFFVLHIMTVQINTTVIPAKAGI